MRRPRPALVVLIGSLVLLVGAPLTWAGFVASGSTRAQSVESIGQRPGGSDASRPSRPPTPDVAGSNVERIGTPVEPTARVEPVPPVRIVIPELGVDAPVDPVGVYEDGSVEIPEDVARVGWYRFGAHPVAGRGSTVIVGHRDGFDQGAGAFYSISALAPGDVVEIQLSDGSIRPYEVVAREAVAKELLPSDDIFDEGGPERLTLVSCIGYFDRDGGGYQENVIVTAVPMSGDSMTSEPVSDGVAS